MQFKELKIADYILKSLDENGYKIPTPIQEQSIPVILEGHDLLACAQTGTGKTAAFAIPTIQMLCEKPNKKRIRALIITPTRELAIQIHENFCKYGKHTSLSCAVVFGGVPQKPQQDALQGGVDILTATPGRLSDLMSQGFVDLKNVEILILDEADRMLDMGFIEDMKTIIHTTPREKQSLLFSATMPTAIVTLAETLLCNPKKIVVTPTIKAVEKIQQSVYYVDKKNKRKLLLHLLQDEKMDTVLLFVRARYEANRLERLLNDENIPAQAIHGDKTQDERQFALANFKQKQIRVLVATDIAARGIDIDTLSYVINYDLPNIPETYVHRIGRTGRAGQDGIAISFCHFDEKQYLMDIQTLIGRNIPVVEDHPFPLLNNFPALITAQLQQIKDHERKLEKAAEKTALKKSSVKPADFKSKYQQKLERKLNEAQTNTTEN